jgi:hypothetical protein
VDPAIARRREAVDGLDLGQLNRLTRELQGDGKTGARNGGFATAPLT